MRWLLVALVACSDSGVEPVGAKPAEAPPPPAPRIAYATFDGDLAKLAAVPFDIDCAPQPKTVERMLATRDRDGNSYALVSSPGGDELRRTVKGQPSGRFDAAAVDAQIVRLAGKKAPGVARLNAFDVDRDGNLYAGAVMALTEGMRDSEAYVTVRRDGTWELVAYPWGASGFQSTARATAGGELWTFDTDRGRKIVKISRWRREGGAWQRHGVEPRFREAPAPAVDWTVLAAGAPDADGNWLFHAGGYLWRIEPDGDAHPIVKIDVALASPLAVAANGDIWLVEPARLVRLRVRDGKVVAGDVAAPGLAELREDPTNGKLVGFSREQHALCAIAPRD